MARSSDPYTVKTLDDLHALYGTPAPGAIRKTALSLTPAYRRMIEASPFFAIASVGPNGLDCSPRGDKGRALNVLDDHTVAIPDRRGNHRLDTLRNIVRDPRCALMLLVPGINETMRINGQAVVSTDPDLLSCFEAEGKQPATVILLKIDEVYFQCARALIRSDLWNPALHKERASLPSAGELAKSAWEEFDAEAYDAGLSERQAKTLY